MLKFIIDAQLPPSLAQRLCEQGHQAEHVQDIGMRDAEDSPIWHYALARNAVVLTKDKDFASRVRQSRKTPVIVWLQIGNCSNRTLHEWFFSLLPHVLQRIAFGQQCIEVC
jgi:predicted nuclease of predicted toxin-antitoxin system